MTELGNLEILGIGAQVGGRFHKVLIAGSGKINGDVECDSFELPGAGKIENGGLTVHGPAEINGAGSVEGSVRAEGLEINGSFKAHQACEVTGNLEVNGSLKVEGPCLVGGDADICGSLKTTGGLTVRDLDVTGAVSVDGRLQAERVEVDGVLKVNGEVQAEEFKADGTVTIEGLLNAETVELSVAGEDLIESIGGASIKVRRGKGWFFSFARKRPHLISNLIEADDVDLEYTDAQTVRGVNVHIGPECVIDRVEYSGSLTTDANCTVREKIRI